jgi:hypothetical protein
MVRNGPGRSGDDVAVKARAAEILESELDSPDPCGADKAFLIVTKASGEYTDGQVDQHRQVLRACQESRLLFPMIVCRSSTRAHDRSDHNPDALVFKHSQQVIEPADYLAACGNDQCSGRLTSTFVSSISRIRTATWSWTPAASRKSACMTCHATFANSIQKESPAFFQHGGVHRGVHRRRCRRSRKGSP